MGRGIQLRPFLPTENMDQPAYSEIGWKHAVSPWCGDGLGGASTSTQCALQEKLDVSVMVGDQIRGRCGTYRPEKGPLAPPHPRRMRSGRARPARARAAPGSTSRAPPAGPSRAPLRRCSRTDPPCRAVRRVGPGIGRASCDERSAPHRIGPSAKKGAPADALPSRGARARRLTAQQATRLGRGPGRGRGRAAGRPAC
jgi:hypothetical protein